MPQKATWKGILDDYKFTFGSDFTKGKGAEHLRSVTWQNIRRAAIQKRDLKRKTGRGGGTDTANVFTTSELLVFDIIGNDSAVLDGLQVKEAWSETTAILEHVNMKPSTPSSITPHVVNSSMLHSVSSDSIVSPVEDHYHSVEQKRDEDKLTCYIKSKGNSLNRQAVIHKQQYSVLPSGRQQCTFDATLTDLKKRKLELEVSVLSKKDQYMSKLLLKTEYEISLLQNQLCPSRKFAATDYDALSPYTSSTLGLSSTSADIVVRNSQSTVGAADFDYNF